MFSNWFGSGQTSDDGTASELANLQGVMAALHRSLAIIEFTPEGTVLSANDNFLKAMGYSASEIQGQHHRLFVDPREAQTPDYQAFWAKLKRGEFHSGRYRRLNKRRQEIWIEATYNPVFDNQGKLVKVIKLASDITEKARQESEAAGKLQAIETSQAVIEFTAEGTILRANANFCLTTGYSENEIVGQHHRMFVDPAEAASPGYRAFWEKLGRGEFDGGRYKRYGKHGKTVWIQATYTPILDSEGRVMKVVKFATDITVQVRMQEELQSAVSATQAVIAAVEAGDLGRRIDTRALDGEVLSLCQSVNALITLMGQVIAQVRYSADAVGVAASEITQGNADLSRRTETQASSIEETASTMEELTATVRQNTHNAGKASEMTGRTQEIVERGGQLVSQVVKTMSDIQHASNRISDIIGVIDGIAFQTNILALNAAVEAARAGEQGRGFAVVATEVRNLAQRSASAAKEIKGLISDAGDKVRNGSELVDRTGKTMAEVVEAIKSVNSIMADIALAGREQASGIEQVNHAVSQMDEVTQQNAALVEEAAAAAESLESQARELITLVSRFVDEPAQPAALPSPQYLVTNRRTIAD